MTRKATSVGSIKVEQVVDLINEFADITRFAAGEGAEPYPELGWLRVPDTETSGLIRIANHLYPTFSDRSVAGRVLNDLADHSGLRHRLDGDARLNWMRRAGSNELLAMATASLIDFIASYGIKPLGVCTASQCADVYIDQSQAQNRAYCSQRCNNRARAIRWRAKQRNHS